MFSNKVISLFAGLLATVSAYAQVPTDTASVSSLDSAVVFSVVRTVGINGSAAKGLDITMSALETYPKVLGTADPLKYVQSLPGVTTNSEWESGLIIQGCEAGQSIIKLCDTPVYGQGRLLGLFSVFNPGHFSRIRFRTSTTSRRIGGELSLDTADTLARALHGEANIGPVSAHATMAFPIGKKSSMTVSGRRSFIDIFYKGLLKMDDAEMNYRFYDINASYLYRPDKFNTVDVNAYFGIDDGNAGADKASQGISASWGNAVANARWRHRKNGLDLTTQAYASAYFMNGYLTMGANSGCIDDHIANVAIHSKAEWRGWDFSAEVDYYDIQPQNVHILSSASKSDNILTGQHAVLSTLKSSYSLSSGGFTLTPSLAASLYSDLSDKNLFPRIDPELSAEYFFCRGHRLNLDFGYRHQYLFMTGLTNSGFPVEFWLGCGKYSKPQASLYGTLSYCANLADDAFSVNLQAYGKKLWNIVEYSGGLADITDMNYNLQDMLLTGCGYNYGVTAQIQKNSGRLTGWISYGWGRALRRFDNPDFPYIYPSSHERQHELNAVVSYKIRRWNFGGNFIFASGVPYTPATSAYILNQTLMVKYGERNSKRLSPYLRLDLSVGFDIRNTGRFRDGVNISVQNATARDNQMTAILKIKDGMYSYAPTKFLIPVLPSINYYCTF